METAQVSTNRLMDGKVLSYSHDRSEKLREMNDNVNFLHSNYESGLYEYMMMLPKFQSSSYLKSYKIVVVYKKDC